MLLALLASRVMDVTNQAELVQACGPKESHGKLCEWTYNVTSSQHAAEVADYFSKPLRALGIVILAYVVNRIARFFIRRSVRNLAKEKSRARISAFKRRTGLALLDTSDTPSYRSVQRAETIGSALRGVTTFVITIAALLLILATYNVKIAPLLAGAGLIGVAIGFGAQSMIRDFLSGIFIIIEDWYGVGDVIDAGEASGTVEQVTLRATRLRDQYGVVWHIPNGAISRAGNKSQQWGRALLDIGVALDTDLDFAQRVIKETADALAADEMHATEIIDEPEVLGVEEIGTNSIIIRVIIKTTPASQWKIARELRARIKRAFDEQGIELPPPTHTTIPRDNA